MQITEKAWVEYITKMSQISQKAADLMQSWVQKNGFENNEALLDYAYALSQHYGQAIGALSCQMYEATAAAQGVMVPTAEENPGIDHVKAHELASEKYNYPKEALEYYGNLKKHKESQ